MLRAGRRFQDEKQITITTLQSMVNLYGDYSSGYFDLIISDECHRSIYGKWSGVLKHFDGIQVGLTATPCSAGEDFDDQEDTLFVRDTMRFFEVEKPTFSYKLKEAIRDGYLVPYHIYKAMTVKTAAEGGFEVKRDELDWSAMDAETRAEFEKLFDGNETITIDPSALERRFTIPERNRAIVREYRQVLENGYHDGKGILRKPMIGKTIVFAVNKRHAETLANMFDTTFAGHKESPEVRYADYVVSGMGSDDTLDGMSKIKRFKKEPYPKILVSVNMLDIGFDCPPVVNLVFTRFTRSSILYQQMRGRGTRKIPGKPSFTMFDFAGVCDYHGDDDEMAEGGLVAETPRKKYHEPRRLLALDIDDHIDPTTREWITLDADGNMVFPEISEQKAAELGARFEAWLLSQNDLSPNETSWLRVVVRKFEISFPSIQEQRRLVDILFRADGIVRLRREAQKKAAEIIPALFFDMFGDPATNQKEWEVAPLGAIAEVVSGVTKGRKFNGKKTVVVPYLRVANVQAGFLNLAEVKEIEVLPSDVQALTLQHGDVLLTEGGDFDKLGRGALWEHDIPNCIHQNHVFRVRLDNHKAISEYFVSYLQSNKAKEYFLRSAKQTTNLASINMTQLRSLPVLLPPLELQSAFLERFQAMRSVLSQQAAATAKAKAIFNALLGQIFKARCQQ